METLTIQRTHNIMNIGKLDLTTSPSMRSVWIAWAVAAVLSVAVYLPTLTLTKHIWQDEVQILELGRGVFGDLDQTHSMAWQVTKQRPAASVAYLGPSLQEISYRVFAPSPAGPRISSILGAVLASAALLGWLFSRGTIAWVAAACSLLLVWDPLFVEGYRGARVDSWSMASMLVALWIIAGGLENDKELRFRPARWQVAAGLFIALAGLVWVSAVLLLPLVALQCLQGSSNSQPGELRPRIAALVWIGVFAFFFFTLLLIPLAPNLATQFADLKAGVGDKTSEGINLAAFLAPYVRSPWVPLVALAGIIYARLWGLGLALVAAAWGVLMTGAYVHRSVYLLPYFLVAIAASTTVLLRSNKGSRLKPIFGVAVLVLLLAWSAGLGLGARTLIAWKERQFRNPDLLRVMLRDKISPQPIKAYLVPYELYYAARELGWKAWRSYGSEDWEDSDLRALLSNMDVVVQRADGASQNLDTLMQELGFSRHIVAAGPGPAQRRENYGEYLVYQSKSNED
jgi:hypothetical protein